MFCLGLEVWNIIPTKDRISVVVSVIWKSFGSRTIRISTLAYYLYNYGYDDLLYADKREWLG